jgi:hypothetical protein
VPLFYLTLMTSSRSTLSLPKGTRKRKAGRSDSIRSMGFGKDLGWNFSHEHCREIERLASWEDERKQAG